MGRCWTPKRFLRDLGNASATIPGKYRLNACGDTNDMPNTYGMHIGAVGLLGLDRLRVGVGVFLPVDHVAVQNSHFPDEREQYFSNRLDFEYLASTCSIRSSWQVRPIV